MYNDLSGLLQSAPDTT